MEATGVLSHRVRQYVLIRHTICLLDVGVPLSDRTKTRVQPLLYRFAS